MPPKATVAKTKTGALDQVKKTLKVKKPASKDALQKAIEKAQATQSAKVDRNKALQAHVQMLAEKARAQAVATPQKAPTKKVIQEGILKNSVASNKKAPQPTKRVSFKSTPQITEVATEQVKAASPPTKRAKEAKEVKPVGSDPKLEAAV